MKPRRVLAGGLAVAIVGVGYVAYAANADAPSYRTATATVGDVEQTLDVSGSVEPAGRADLAFATSGTIASVSVAAGDTVKAGAVLGRLDATSLRKDLQHARATLAQAEAQLESDEDAQTTTVQAASASTATTTAPTVTPSASPTETPTETPSTGPDPLADLAAEQQAVTDAQSTVSASLAAAQEALAAQQTACTDALADEAADQACTDALTAVQAAQQQVSTDQDALQVALEALGDTMTQALAALEQSSDAPVTEAEPEAGNPSQPQTKTPTTQPATTQPATTSAPTVSASTLARDQAAIDQAKADLITAEQALRTATVTAPFAGTVVAVDAAAGDSIASGTEAFVLVAPGTTTVQVEATSAQVQQLAIGQEATATPVGSDRALVGTVTQISTVPDDSSAYPVTITLNRKNLDIATGLNASVSVVTGTAEDVVTVPASAVTDGTAMVVGDDGNATRTRVTTGVVGATTVEVAEGLENGDDVVLADIDQALPTTDETGDGGFGGDFPSSGFGGPQMVRRG